MILLQATVQATLAALPMDQVQALIPKNSPVYAENMRWAEDALVTAIFCILICGSLGTLLIRYSRSFLLERVTACHSSIGFRDIWVTDICCILICGSLDTLLVIYSQSSLLEQ